MQITQFISNFPKNEKSIIYGKSAAATNLCLSLARRGNSVQVFTPSEDRKDCIENYNGVEVHRYGSFIGYRSERFSLKILYKPLNYDADIVHIHSGISMTVIAGYRYALKKKVPLVITWHGDSIRGYGRYGKTIPRVAAYFYKKYLADKILSHADIIISPSEYYINESIFLGKYKDKIIAVPNGVNFEELDIPYSKEECKNELRMNGKNVILFMSALYSLKGPHILLRSIPKIVKEHKDSLFIFVGGGDIDKYKRLSEELGVKEYVRFTGYIKESLKPIYYRAADLFVLPSAEKFEVFPLVLLEASTFGLPIVVSDLNTFRCIIEDGYNGIFTKMRDENNLADAIIYLLENEDIMEKMGKNARKKVEGYSWENIAEETERVYKELIDERYQT